MIKTSLNYKESTTLEMVRNFLSEFASISKAWYRLRSHMKSVSSPINFRTHQKMSDTYSQWEHSLLKYLCFTVSNDSCWTNHFLLAHCNAMSNSSLSINLSKSTRPSHAIFLILNNNTSISYRGLLSFSLHVFVLLVFHIIILKFSNS